MTVLSGYRNNEPSYSIRLTPHGDVRSLMSGGRELTRRPDTNDGTILAMAAAIWSDTDPQPPLQVSHILGRKAKDFPTIFARKVAKCCNKTRYK